jgi:hypothetical protein
MTDAELNEHIIRAQADLSRKRKRGYLAAIARGQHPVEDPFEFDEPVAAPVLHPEPPQQRPRREGGVKIQLPQLKFKGGSYSELQNFVFELESRFLMYTEDFYNESTKVVYAASSLQGSVRTR